MTYNFPRQTLNITFRLAGLCLTAMGLFWAAYEAEKYAVFVLLAGFFALQYWALLKKLTGTDREIMLFLDAVRFADFSQKLGRSGQGASPSALAKSFDEVMEKFKNNRARHEKEARYHRALIDHVPVALLTITGQGDAQLLNNAAKKLFNISSIRRISDLAPYGDALTYELRHLRPGKKRLIRLSQRGEDIKLSLAATKVVIGGNASYLVSLQNIQSELDTTQIEAWQDLVHVLTHELMNSLTPVASLSNSMNVLVQDIRQQAAQESLSNEFKDMLQDLSDGIDAISRRSLRLDTFVANYRKMTKVPPPEYQTVQISAQFDTMKTLFEETCQAGNITFSSEVIPRSLSLQADPQLLDQAMINLIKNATEILAETKNPHLTLKAFLDPGGKTLIEVSDNGPGIDEDVLQKIFVPFYTTKQLGSGIGLSLSRQIMLAHQGSISCHNRDPKIGGCSFRLSFPR